MEKIQLSVKKVSDNLYVVRLPCFEQKVYEEGGTCALHAIKNGGILESTDNICQAVEKLRFDRDGLLLVNKALSNVRGSKCKTWLDNIEIGKVLMERNYKTRNNLFYVSKENKRFDMDKCRFSSNIGKLPINLIYSTNGGGDQTIKRLFNISVINRYELLEDDKWAEVFIFADGAVTKHSISLRIEKFCGNMVIFYVDPIKKHKISDYKRFFESLASKFEKRQHSNDKTTRERFKMLKNKIS